MTKFCKHCGKDKPLTAFWPDVTTADKLRHNCSECETRRNKGTRRYTTKIKHHTPKEAE